MARHSVTFQPPARKLEQADVVFQVRSDGEKLGTLKVSKGSVVWLWANKQYGFKMGWERFGEMMEEHARRYELR